MGTMASMDMMNHNDTAHSAEPHVKYNNFVDSEDSPGPSGKGPLNKLKKFNCEEGGSGSGGSEQPCSSKAGLENSPSSSDDFEMSQFNEVQEITEKSQQICSVISQIRDTFHTLFNQPTHVVPLRQNKRSKHSVVMKHHKMNIGTKIKFELYGEQCINWLKYTIKLIKNFYDAWIPKAQQNVIDLKQTATTLEKSDEHISQLLYVKDSQIMGDWDSGETVFLQHAVSDLSTYILTLKTYRLKEKLHQEYTIIEQNIYALLESLHSTQAVLKRHYKIFGKLNTVDRGSEEEDEDWITEEIVDVEHNKVYTREVAI
ncbi:hypothetical protein ACHWQZ_G016645 [Mnemiopsis leidyi]